MQIETHETQPSVSNVPADAKTGAKLPGYYLQTELAEMLNKSQATLWRWTERGYGPPVTKVGNLVYYKISSVEKWLGSLERRPTDQRGRKRTTRRGRPRGTRSRAAEAATAGAK
jgi:predicted DNA-binding transcriptional regulator AlpA